MFQVPFQWNAYNLHVVMRMRLEPSTSRNVIIIQHAQRAKMHPFRIVPTGKTEGMVSVEPTVIGVATGIRCVVNVLR
jgi:hypothetical protein